MTIALTVLLVINCVVLSLGFAVLLHLATGNRKTSAAERFYHAWEDHLRGGFAGTQEAADVLAKRYGLAKAPPLADDEKSGA